MFFYAWIKRQNLRYDFSRGNCEQSLCISLIIYHNCTFCFVPKILEQTRDCSQCSLPEVRSKLKKIRAWGVNQTSFLMRFRVRRFSNKTNSFPGQGSLLPSPFSSSEPPVPLAGEAWALGPGRPGPGGQARREWPVPWSEKRVQRTFGNKNDENDDDDDDNSISRMGDIFYLSFQMGIKWTLCLPRLEGLKINGRCATRL